MGKSEQELREFFEAHRGDMSIWQSQPVDAAVPPASTVISIRLNRRELVVAQRHAQQRGMTIGAWMKRLVLEDFNEAGWVTITPHTARLLRR